MRWYVRIVFGLNTLYQLAVGCVGLFAPMTMLELYGASEADRGVMLLRGAMRGFGYSIVFFGATSAVVAKDPDRHPILLLLMALLSVLTMLAWGLAMAAGEMTAEQVGLDIVVQVLLLVGAIGYYPRAKKTAPGS